MRKEEGLHHLSTGAIYEYSYLVNAGTFISGPKSILTSGYAGMIVAY